MKQIKYYLYSNRDSNYMLAEELELTKVQMQNFRYCCYEVVLDVDVHEDGTTYATHLNGVALPQPVPV